MRRTFTLSLTVLVALVVTALWLSVWPDRAVAPTAPTAMREAVNTAPEPQPHWEAAERTPEPSSLDSASVETSPDRFLIGVSVQWTDSLNLPGFRPDGLWVRLERGDSGVILQSQDGGEVLAEVGEAEFLALQDAVTSAWRLRVDADFAWDGGRSEVEVELENARPVKLDEHTCSFRVALDTADFPEGYMLVRGRVVHGSGESLAGQPFRVYSPQWLREQDASVVTLNHDGGFATLLDIEDPGDREKRNPCAPSAWGFEQSPEAWATRLRTEPWGVCHQPESEPYRYDSVTPLATKPPLRAVERVIELGDIQLRGGLLKAVSSGTPRTVTATYEIWMGRDSLRGDWRLEPSPPLLILPPGRIFYEIQPSLDDVEAGEAVAEAYEQLVLPGHVDLLDGHCTELLITLPRLEYVTVSVVSADGPIEDASLFVDWDRLSDLSHGPRITYDGDEPGHVLRTGRPNLRVTARAEGYVPKTVGVPAEAASLIIELEKAPPPVEVRSGIEVTMDLPDSLSDSYRVIAFDQDGRQDESYAYLSKSQLTATIRCQPGIWRVGVFGGILQGYPGGMISGLVQVEVLPDRFTSVRMPQPSPPPFEQADYASVRLTCGQQSFWGTHFVRMPDGKAVLETRHGSGDPWPIALVDALGDVPLAIKRHDSGDLALTADLPVRVRVSTTGEEFWGATARLERDNGEISLAEFHNNRANLWLPPGATTLRVANRSGIVFEQVVDVPESGTLEVNFENTLGMVQVKPALVDGRETDWVLLRRDSTRWLWCENVRGQILLYLTPGDYMLLPSAAELIGRHDFTVHAACDIVIEPEIDRVAPCGDVFLPLPPEFQEIAVEAELEVRKAALSEQLAGFPKGADLEQKTLDYSFAPGGLMLKDVPVDVEIVLSGWVRRGERRQFLLPDKVSVQASSLKVKAPKWAQAREFKSGLYDDPAEAIWTVSGCAGWCRLEDHLPVGQVKLQVHSGQQTETFDLFVPAGDDVFVPPEFIRDRLAALGWLDDD